MDDQVLMGVGPEAIDALAEAWASMDGHLKEYRAEREQWLATGQLDREAPGYTGHWDDYRVKAEELIGRLLARGFVLTPISEVTNPQHGDKENSETPPDTRNTFTYLDSPGSKTILKMKFKPGREG